MSIASTGFIGGYNVLDQLAEKNNDLTTVTISGSEQFYLGDPTAIATGGDGVVTDIAATATSPTKIASSLTLIDASATTGEVKIFAGATNTSGAGNFDNGEGASTPTLRSPIPGSRSRAARAEDFIENDAKNGIVTDGNGRDKVVLGGAGAKATLGTGPGDTVDVGTSDLGTNEAAGNALGDRVKLGAAATAELRCRHGRGSRIDRWHREHWPNQGP